jgi:hypothetical protein
MELKSFGCSFIFGNDLADDGRKLSIPTPSNYTWPALMAKKLNYNYNCLARPGSGNLQIAERVLSHTVESNSIFFVIGWTWIDRFDYTGSTISNLPKGTKWTNWKTLMPVNNDTLTNTYYKELHSEYRDKVTSLMYIKLVIDTLNQKGIPFLMTYQDSLLFDQRWNHTPAVIDLQDFIKPYMTQFEEQSFLDWSQKKGYAVSSTLHPLEQAHAAAADYMIKIFDKQKINGPIQPVPV